MRPTMNCEICNHVKREKIEQALICRSLGDSSITIDSIAKEFNVSSRELQVHALMHTYQPEVLDPIEGSEKQITTLTAAIKFKEAETLQATAQEYYGTLKNLGAKINGMINTHTDENPTLHRLSKATVDLYLGLGSEIRGTMDTLIKMNSAVNGESNNGLEALGSLVKAIQLSGGVKDDGDTI